MYTNELEEEAFGQLQRLAMSPYVVGYVAAMPDVHVGKGATVGSVFATAHHVAPMAVVWGTCQLNCLEFSLMRLSAGRGHWLWHAGRSH